MLVLLFGTADHQVVRLCDQHHTVLADIGMEGGITQLACETE